MKYFPIKRKKQLLVISTAFLLLFACAPLKYNYTTNQLPFKTVGLIPIVDGMINGKRAIFIIDTGASVSILNEADAMHFGFWCAATTNQSVVGFNGESKINEVFNCKVEFGPHVIRGVAFKTRHLTDLAEIIRQHEHINIAGIIGADILNRYKVSIDFRSNTISFEGIVNARKNPLTAIPEYQ